MNEILANNFEFFTMSSPNELWLTVHMLKRDSEFTVIEAIVSQLFGKRERKIRDKYVKWMQCVCLWTHILSVKNQTIARIRSIRSKPSGAQCTHYTLAFTKAPYINLCLELNQTKEKENILFDSFVTADCLKLVRLLLTGTVRV